MEVKEEAKLTLLAGFKKKINNASIGKKMVVVEKNQKSNDEKKTLKKAK